MSKKTKTVSCRDCEETFDTVPKRSFVGFIKFTCPKCNKKIVGPLTKSCRFFYWVWGVIAWLLFIANNGFGFVVAVLKGNAKIGSLSSISVPEIMIILYLLLAPIYALVKDYILRRKNVFTSMILK